MKLVATVGALPRSAMGGRSDEVTTSQWDHPHFTFVVSFVDKAYDNAYDKDFCLLNTGVITRKLHPEGRGPPRPPGHAPDTRLDAAVEADRPPKLWLLRARYDEK